LGGGFRLIILILILISFLQFVLKMD
jgi:hypothetical protein